MINLLKLTNLNLDKKKIALIALGLLVICYIDFSFILKAQFQGISRSKSKVEKLKKDIKELKNGLVSFKNAKGHQAGERKQDNFLKSQRIILEEEVPLLLQEISGMADSYKVNIAQIQPIKDAKAKEEDFEGKSFLPIKIALVMSADYHALGGFLWAIEDANVFISFSDMKIVRRNDNSFLENINLTLKAYVAK